MSQLKNSLNSIDLSLIPDIQVIDNIPASKTLSGSKVDAMPDDYQRNIVYAENPNSDANVNYFHILNFSTTNVSGETITFSGYDNTVDTLKAPTSLLLGSVYNLRPEDYSTIPYFLYSADTTKWTNPHFQDIYNQKQESNMSFDIIKLNNYRSGRTEILPQDKVEGVDYIITSYNINSVNTYTIADIVGKQHITQSLTQDFSLELINDGNLQEKAEPIIDGKVNNKLGLPLNANVVQVNFETEQGACNVIGYQENSTGRRLQEGVQKLDGSTVIKDAVANSVNQALKEKPNETRETINAASKDDVKGKIGIPNNMELVNIQVKGKENGKGKRRKFNLVAYQEKDGRRLLEEQIEDLEKEKATLSYGKRNLKNVGKSKRTRIQDIDKEIAYLKEAKNDPIARRGLEESVVVDGDDLLFNNFVNKVQENKHDFRSKIDTKKSSEIAGRGEIYGASVPASIVGGVLGYVGAKVLKKFFCPKKKTQQEQQQEQAVESKKTDQEVQTDNILEQIQSNSLHSLEGQERVTEVDIELNRPHTANNSKPLGFKGLHKNQKVASSMVNFHQIGESTLQPTSLTIERVNINSDKNTFRDDVKKQQTKITNENQL